MVFELLDPNYNLTLKGPDGSWGDYKWYSFEEVYKRSLLFGSGLKQLGKSRQFVALCGKSRLEWAIADFACTFQSFITVAIHTAFGRCTQYEVVCEVLTTFLKPISKKLASEM